MDRWACVDVPALALQLVLRRRPEWRGLPVAVVAEDRPQGRILWVNECAREARIWPGRSYAEGLSLDSELRADVVAAEELAAAESELLEVLRAFSPRIEPSSDEAGVFWLDATGIDGLFESLQAWGRELIAALRRAGLQARVAVGFQRFASYAVARALAGRGDATVYVADDERTERQQADRVSLLRLGFPPRLRDALLRLGIDRLGGFRRLPAGSVRARFGAEAEQLHRLVCGREQTQLVPREERIEVRERMERQPDEVQIDVAGLLFLCKQRLARLVLELRQRSEVVTGLRLRLMLDKGGIRDEAVRPAEPTLDEVQLTDLLRLRLESVQLDAELEGFELVAESAPARSGHGQLFAAARRRDLRAANRALARLRAEWGDEAVVRAELRDGHLPEARFAWRPLDRVRDPQPDEVASPRLVRRVFDRPRLLPRPTATDHGRGEPVADVQGLSGPYPVSGGWWRREQHRDYYFAETRTGELLWVYYDRQRRRWFLQGVVD